jgi:hypothetical protein
VFAQIGVGYRDAWFTVTGGIVGAMTFGYLEPVLRPILLSGGPGKPTFDQSTHVPFWALAVGMAALLAVALVAAERLQPWRDEIGTDIDGTSPMTWLTVPSYPCTASIIRSRIGSRSFLASRGGHTRGRTWPSGDTWHPQLGQAEVSGAAHSSQNFAVAGFSCWRLRHFIAYPRERGGKRRIEA